MVITRVIDGKVMEIELTDSELGDAHEEYVIAFMRNTLVNDFSLSREDADSVSRVAYDKYCEGDGLTEYECIEDAYNEYCEENYIL